MVHTKLQIEGEFLNSSDNTQKVTLWYRHDKSLDVYTYNHIQFNGWYDDLVPKGSTPRNNKNFKTSLWLKEFCFIKNRKVIRKDII